MSDYNYTEFKTDAYDLDRFAGPRPGDKAPDFTLQTADWIDQRLLDFEGDFLVLEMGSLTCPLFQGRRDGMARLRTQYPNCDFRIHYVREAHPGAKIPAHSSQQDKTACATALREDAEGRLILIDDEEGSAHQAFGGYPNSVFVINKQGCVLWFTDWNNPKAVERALAQISVGQPAVARALFKPVPPWVALRTLLRGGKGATADFFRGLPTLIWKNLIKRNWRIMRGHDVGIAPDHSC